eukprot:352544-Chlamydomonas_euryale.AAC.22
MRWQTGQPAAYSRHGTHLMSRATKSKPTCSRAPCRHRKNATDKTTDIFCFCSPTRDQVGVVALARRRPSRRLARIAKRARRLLGNADGCLAYIAKQASELLLSCGGALIGLEATTRTDAVGRHLLQPRHTSVACACSRVQAEHLLLDPELPFRDEVWEPMPELTEQEPG